MHYGIISPPVSGHIHPFGALGRELIERGHRVTLVHMEDVRQRALSENLEFRSIGSLDHPAGSLPLSLARLGQLNGLPALRFTVQAVRRTTEMFLRDGPAVIRDAKIGALLVDQTEPAGATIAEHLCLPFVTVCNALNLNEEPGVPPPFTSWTYRTSAWARFRNSLGYRVSGLFLSPVTQVVAQYRRKFGLAPCHPRHSFSPLAQISQLPPGFDYPRTHLPATFHYTGPLRKPLPVEVPFPWDRLNGRPLVYASLGTLQNGRERVFQTFAAACAGLPVQLVIAGMEPKSSFSAPGETIAVKYAPQLPVLRRTALTLTHGGLNTVLDSLACGVPMVAVPINYEQPAIAERVRWSGAGEVIPFPSLTVVKLREALALVLKKASYAERAAVISRSIQAAGGVRRATDLIELAIVPATKKGP